MNTTAIAMGTTSTTLSTTDNNNGDAGDDIPTIVADYLSVVEDRDSTIYALSEDNIALKAAHHRMRQQNEDLTLEVHRLRALHEMNEKDTGLVLASVGQLHNDLTITTEFYNSILDIVKECEFRGGRHSQRNSELVRQLTEKIANSDASSPSSDISSVAVQLVGALRREHSRNQVELAESKVRAAQLEDAAITCFLHSETSSRIALQGALLENLNAVYHNIRGASECNLARLTVFKATSSSSSHESFDLAMQYVSLGDIPSAFKELLSYTTALRSHIQAQQQEATSQEAEMDLMKETIVTQYRLLSSNTDSLNCLKDHAFSVIAELYTQFTELRGAAFTAGDRANPFLSAAAQMQLEKGKIDTLQMINNELRQQMVASGKRSLCHKKEAEEKFTAEKVALEEEKSKLSTHISELRNRLSESIQRENALKRAGKEKDSQFNDAVSALKSKVDALLLKSDETATQNAELSASLKRAKQDAVDWQNKYDRCQDTLAHVRKETDATKEELLVKHDREIKTMQSRIEELDDNNLESVESLRRAQESLVKFENIHAMQMETMVEDHSRDMRDLQRNLSVKYEETILHITSDAEREISQIKESAWAERSTLLDGVEQLEDRCEALKAGLEECNASMRILEQRNIEKEAEVSKLRDTASIVADMSAEEATFLKGLLEGEREEVVKLQGELLRAKRELERTLSRHEVEIASQHHMQRLQDQVEQFEREEQERILRLSQHQHHQQRGNSSFIQTPDTSLISHAPEHHNVLASVDQSVMTEDSSAVFAPPLSTLSVNRPGAIPTTRKPHHQVLTDTSVQPNRDNTATMLTNNKRGNVSFDAKELQRRISSLEKENKRLLHACEISANISAELREQVHRQHNTSSN